MCKSIALKLSARCIPPRGAAQHQPRGSAAHSRSVRTTRLIIMADAPPQRKGAPAAQTAAATPVCRRAQREAPHQPPLPGQDPPRERTQRSPTQRPSTTTQPRTAFACPWYGGQPPLVSHDRGLAAVAEDAASSASSAVYSLSVGTPDWRVPIQGWGRAPLTRSIVLLAMPATLQPAGRVSSPRVSPRLITRKKILDRSFHK